jgi:hypothetical protein
VPPAGVAAEAARYALTRRLLPAQPVHDLVGWLEPEVRDACGVREAVGECAALLAQGLAARRFVLTDGVADIEGQVMRCAVRNVLTAALLHATDEFSPPAVLRLHASANHAGVTLVVSVHPAQGEFGGAQEPGYRALTWIDVECLARSEGALARRATANEIALYFPWA